MYEEFYNLQEKPFNLTPSPRFLYLGEQHKEALSLLTYGVVERKGFILLTGEVGTGKTTMIQALLESLDQSVQYVLLANPLLSPMDFMNHLGFSILKRKTRFRSKGDFLLKFEEFLKEGQKRRMNFNLIIDEAQQLTFELLEEIRLLSNMESAEEKLMNIFLIGQPELNEKLSDARCRPLLQRISIRHNIAPLDLKGSENYIFARLRIAGAKKGKEIFPTTAIKAIYEFTDGYPRLINVLADNCLLLGYSQSKKKISPQMVKECYADMKIDNLSPADPLKTELPDETERAPVSGARYWKWATFILLILLILLLFMSRAGCFLWDPKVSSMMPGSKTTEKRIAPPSENDTQKGLGKKIDLPARTEVQSSTIQQKGDIIGLKNPAIIPGKDDRRKTQILPKKYDKIPTVNVLPKQERAPSSSSVESPKPEPAPYKTLIVTEGDTLTELIEETYGYINYFLIEQVKKENPNIKDIHRLKVGQKVKFPKQPSEEQQKNPES
ncbi:AAA family ATPase [Thermodesulfobacteriota bacterium]